MTPPKMSPSPSCFESRTMGFLEGSRYTRWRIGMWLRDRATRFAMTDEQHAALLLKEADALQEFEITVPTWAGLSDDAACR